MTPSSLKAVLKHLVLTQRTVSSLTGLSVTAVNAWAKGRAPIPPWAPMFLAMWAMLDDDQRARANLDADIMDRE